MTTNDNETEQKDEPCIAVYLPDKVDLGAWIEQVGNALNWSQLHKMKEYGNYKAALITSIIRGGWTIDNNNTDVFNQSVITVNKDRFLTLLDEMEERWTMRVRSYQEKRNERNQRDKQQQERIERAYQQRGYITLDDID